MSFEFQPLLDDQRARNNAPGVSVAIRLSGKLLWNGASGIGITPNARFPIYSITKTFTAVCVLALEQEGLLKIQDSVTDFFPDLSLPKTLKLAHLLQHTSGIRDYGPLPEYHAAVKTTPSSPWSEQQFLNATLPKGLLFEPGTGWAYSNISYMLLRRTIGIVTGQSFRECVHQRIVERLHLADTFIAEQIEDWKTCVAGYGTEVSARDESVDVRCVYHPGWCAPGVAVSTSQDTTRFYDSLFAGELLSNEQLTKMLQMVRVPGSHPPAVTPSSGLGIFGDPDSRFGPSYGHGGGGPGYNLANSILPSFHAGRLAIAAFCNSSRSNAQAIGDALLKYVLQRDPRHSA